MVTTRRAAKAAAAAAAAATTTSAAATSAAATAASDAVADVEPPVGQQPVEQQPVEQQPVEQQPVEQQLLEQQPVPSAPAIPVEPAKPRELHRAPPPPSALAKAKASRRLVCVQLCAGHACALLSVAVAAHAASRPSAAPLPVHALLLLGCILPLRLLCFLRAVMLIPRHISLALAAAHIFASNILTFLAVRADPTSLNLFLAAGALQVSAAWMSMIVSASAPPSSPSSPSLPVLLLHSASDLYLASVVARLHPFNLLARPVLWLRLLFDALSTLRSAAVIIATQDRPSKSPSTQSTTTSTTTVTTVTHQE